MAIWVPPEERAGMDALAARIGCSRSRLLRVGYAVIAAEDEGVIRARLVKLPAARRPAARAHSGGSP